MAQNLEHVANYFVSEHLNTHNDMNRSDYVAALSSGQRLTVCSI